MSILFSDIVQFKNLNAHITDPQSHHTGLAKRMETEQSSLKSVNVLFLMWLTFGVAVSCPLTFHTQTAKDAFFPLLAQSD